MDYINFSSMLSNTVKKFRSLTKHPEKYLQTQDNVAEEVKSLLKEIYDFTKKQEDPDPKPTALPELIIKDFDDEQIWQELELQNSAKCDQFYSDVPHLLASKNRLSFYSGNRESSSEESDKNDIQPENEINENELSDSEKFLEKPETAKKNVQRRTIKPSIVDDQFFKLSELEEFLNLEDRKENNKNKKQSHIDDSDESIDLFGSIPSDEDEMEEGGAHYNEFFDAPLNKDDQQESNKRKKKDSEAEKTEDEFVEGNFLGDSDGEPSHNADFATKNEKQVRFDLSPASSTSSESEDEKNNNKDKEKGKVMSTFETRQERLQERIKALEEKALAEKPWQLKGEVTSTTRPENSLLEEVLEFDSTARPAPVVTEQTTMKLEDIIRQRIKDKSWDDVERKVKPTIGPDEYKKTLVLNQEKSKFSLAEIYEQEYLKQKEALDPNADEKPEEEPQEHQTIRAMTSSLFAKLDALTNFHYTPKPVIPEVKIVNNLPAITMEEVAPVNASDAMLLAPEEVKAKKKGELMDKSERTKTDKKRERRLKKKHQRVKKQEEEKRLKIVEKLRPGLGNKYSKERALDTLKKLSTDKNVYQVQDEGKDKGVRSSTAFFSQLQEEVSSHKKEKTNEPKKKEKEKLTVKKIKL